MTNIIPKTLDHYSCQVAAQHRDRPKFKAWYSSLVDRVVDLQNLSQQVCDGYDINTAVGVQLDKIGERIGAPRTLEIPIAINTFGFGLGPSNSWQVSVWAGSGDDTKITTLPDQYYRLYLFLKTYINRWDGSKKFALESYQEVFPKSLLTENIVVELTDNFNMTLNYVITGVSDVVIAGMFANGRFLFTPMGVTVTVSVTGF